MEIGNIGKHFNNFDRVVYIFPIVKNSFEIECPSDEFRDFMEEQGPNWLYSPIREM